MNSDTMNSIMPPSVVERVESLLKQHEVAFQVLRHEPVYTSKEAARVRGTPLASGAKAHICKGEDRFVMFVVPADSSRAIFRHIPPAASGGGREAAEEVRWLRTRGVVQRPSYIELGKRFPAARPRATLLIFFARMAEPEHRCLSTIFALFSGVPAPSAAA